MRTSFLTVVALVVAVGCGSATPAADVPEPAWSPAPAPPGLTASPEREAPLVVCSWNIKWFGQKEPDGYRFDWLSKSLEKCDVVAIQEVTGAHYTPCMRELKKRLNASEDVYRYRVSPPTGYEGSGDPDKGDYTERFAFLWRTDRVALDGTPHFVANPTLNNATYRQVPWIATFKVTGGDGFDFDLMSVHTAYNKKLNLVRKAEIEAIRDWVLAASTRDEKNAIAVGDFNANPSGQPKHFGSVIPATTSDMRVLMYEPLSAGEPSTRTTVPTKDATPGTSYYELPVYDHVFISLATSPALLANPMLFSAEHLGVDRFDDDPSWSASEGRDYRRSHVSDHRPIWFKLDYGAADAD